MDMHTDVDSLDISIIVPVYNMESAGLLKRCMDSLVNQTIFDHGYQGEIIVIDDASTDSSLSELYRYQKEYPGKIQVIAREINGRQGAARNDGLKVAKGKWIGFVDADDWVDVTMFEKLLEKAEHEGSDMAGCYYGIVEDYETKVAIPQIGFLRSGLIDLDELETWLCVGDTMWNKIFLRSTIINQSLYFPENQFYEDNAISCFMYAAAHKYSQVEEVLYYYYQNPLSTCNTIDYSKIIDRLKAADIYFKHGKRLGYYRKNAALIEYGYFTGVYIRTIPHVWRSNFRDRVFFLREIRKRMKVIHFLRNNEYMMKYTPNKLREVKMIKISIYLLMLYHAYQTVRNRFRG